MASLRCATRRVMTDMRTDRGYDGIDGPTRVNRNAGAESTVEAILALERVANDPDAAEGSVMRPLGNPALSLASVPASREYAGPDGAKLVLRRDSAGVPMI